VQAAVEFVERIARRNEKNQTADFRRVFELDPAIDTSRIVAKMNQGVLTLSLPKSEQVKPRKIAVND
jgi:HSP20 family protein